MMKNSQHKILTDSDMNVTDGGEKQNSVKCVTKTVLLITVSMQV